MRFLCKRSTTRRMIQLAASVTVIGAFWLAAPFLGAARVTAADPSGPMTLLGTLSEWKYPGLTMLGGATMRDGGNPAVVDVRCQAILTTTDAFEKVARFYSEKLGTPAAAGDQNGRTESSKDAGARSISTQDDSERRPVAVKIIVVNKSDTTTTLVISRAKGEEMTHIAWIHYRRFNG
jgi:hypothetical protein